MNKNIAFAHVNFPEGGAETVTSYISKYLISKGYNVTIFVVSLVHENLIDCHPATTFIELPNKYIDTKENIDFIVEKLSQNNISVLIAKDIIKNLSYLRSRTTVKLVYAFHNTPLWESVDSMISRKKRIKNSFLKKMEWYLLRYLKYKLFVDNDKKCSKIYKGYYNNVDSFTVLCEEYGFVMAKLIGVNYETSKIVALNNPNIEAPEPVNLNKKKQVLYVGRLSHNDKRVDRLIYIWSLLEKDFPDWELLIIGSGTEEENLKRQAQTLHLQNCKFCGYTTNVSQYLQNASILCLTSTFEGWGLALTEAQKYGVVPCAFDCSAGVHTVLSPDRVNGVLVKCFSTKEYAKRLAELMKNDELRECMKLNVIEKAKDYNIEVVGAKWEHMLEKLLKE